MMFDDMIFALAFIAAFLAAIALLGVGNAIARIKKLEGR